MHRCTGRVPLHSRINIQAAALSFNCVQPCDFLPDVRVDDPASFLLINMHNPHREASMTHEYTDAQRMELRSHVNLAGEVIARLWPMRTFISRNPLQGFEDLPFEDGVREGERLFGAQGYLPHEFYRIAYREGRIERRGLQEALQPLVSDKHVQWGDRRLSHLEVLLTVMVDGIQTPFVPSTTACAAAPADNDPRLDRIGCWLQTVLPKEVWEGDDLKRFPDHERYQETMADWCDRTLGSDITEQLNRHLIKWLAVFCDEGEAAWTMPHREETFFRAWKATARHDVSLRLLGIEGVGRKIESLSDRPEDAVLQSLEMLKIPPFAWQSYLSLHLAALPGWAGYIKWRSEQAANPWQEAYRIDLIKYLAVRLFYERELVAVVCRKAFGCRGDAGALQDYIRQYPYAVWFRQALIAGTLTERASSAGERMLRWWKQADARAWEEEGRQWYPEECRARLEAMKRAHALMLLQLAEAFSISTEAVTMMSSNEVSTLLSWLRSFPADVQSLKWLEAYESAHQSQLLDKLRPSSKSTPAEAARARRGGVRPLAQFAFCIDVRSEVFRRHLEAHGGYETFGFAGFFGLPVAYRSLDEVHEAELCPVLLKPKHVLREVPRTYQGGADQRRKARKTIAKTGQELLHDLKHNVITPYVMVEAVGWLFAWPMLGKTLCPRWYDRLSERLRALFMPPVATTLTVDKLSTKEADEMVAAEQRMQILRWLRAHHRVQGRDLTPDRLERIRLQALGEALEPTEAVSALGFLLVVSKEEERRVLEDLRRDCRLEPRMTSARVDRITRTGFTLNEQAYYVETALRLMGLTRTFGRLIFLCGHGSTSQNNPYESALDCGACGGSQGLPNARAFATIANRPQVRQVLVQRGITIPSDTHFVAAVHDTTTDQVRIADVEDVPSTHRKELAQVLEDFTTTGYEAASERYDLVAPGSRSADGREAARAVVGRSVDWSQVRPEWGLARNSAFIIASRELTQEADLEGRAFLHSYDHTSDEDGRLLEFIMTAPLIVAQWINAEYYFSTVDPERYGSGSKVYHNVTGRIGVMSGNSSDLRMGLPIQSVLDGGRPYHEPMRLTAVIEAPCERITRIINRQPLLKKLFHNRWLRLVAWEPNEQRFYRYNASASWTATEDAGSRNHCTDKALGDSPT